MNRNSNIRILMVLLLAITGFGCTNKPGLYQWKTLEVTATAYNSVPSQTANDPRLAAWGDTLYPGMKCIAVSRDLIERGLDHNTPVRIEGLKGIYLVKDKMHYRWRNKIDIYMGYDVKKAREWGRKKVSIQYAIKKKPADEPVLP